MWYMKDYDFERPDSDFPGYEKYFADGTEETGEQEVWIDDEIDERELFHE